MGLLNDVGLPLQTIHYLANSLLEKVSAKWYWVQ